MSIILDALRKSEAARRRNQAPELFAEMRERAPAPHAQTRVPTWVLVGIPGLGIGALAVALLLMTRGTTTADSATAATTAATNDAEVVAANGTNSSSAPTSSAAISSTNADVADSVDTITPTLAPPPDGTIASAPTPPMPVQNVARAPDTVSSAPPVPRQVATPSSTSSPKPAAAQDTVAATPSPAPPLETAQPPAFRSPGNDAPMALADLDAETRKQLPPLKLSMHMWHDASAQRFVILDGQRLREGDVIGDVVVQRITRDGATLSWRGTALKVEWR